MLLLTMPLNVFGEHRIILKLSLVFKLQGQKILNLIRIHPSNYEYLAFKLLNQNIA